MEALTALVLDRATMAVWRDGSAALHHGRALNLLALFHSSIRAVAIVTAFVARHLLAQPEELSFLLAACLQSRSEMNRVARTGVRAATLAEF